MLFFPSVSLVKVNFSFFIFFFYYYFFVLLLLLLLLLIFVLSSVYFFTFFIRNFSFLPHLLQLTILIRKVVLHYYLLTISFQKYTTLLFSCCCYCYCCYCFCCCCCRSVALRCFVFCLHFVVLLNNFVFMLFLGKSLRI